MTRPRSPIWIGIALLVLVPQIGEADRTARAARDEGAQLYQKGRFEEAATAFEIAAKLSPGSLETWQSLGWAHRKAGHAEKALEVWKRILKIDPVRTGLLNEIATVHMEREAWPEAVKSLERSLAQDPDQNHIRLRLATSLERGGRLRMAAQVFQELVSRDPGNAEAALRLFAFFERNGDEQAAIAALRAAMERIPGEPHVFMPHVARLDARRGDRAYARGDFDDAASAYRDALRSDPRRERYLVNLGWALRNSGALTDAIGAWERARELRPDDPELTRHVADARREQRNMDEAGKLYREVWNLTPGGDDIAAFRLAEIALAEHRVEAAVEWARRLFRKPGAYAAWAEPVTNLFLRFEKPAEGIAFFHQRIGVSEDGGSSDPYLSRLYAKSGQLARRVSDLGAAVRHYRQALVWNPINQEALRDLGWTLWLMEDWEGCRRTWERFSRLQRDDVVPYNLLTQLHLYRRDFDAAMATARASLALEDDQPDEKLKLARSLFWSGRFAEGKALSESLARQNPDDLEIQRFWGELLTRYEDFTRALPQWERVIDLGGADGRARFARLQSMYELGHYEHALDEARRLVSMTGSSPDGLRILARDAILRGNLAEAAEWQEQLVELTPERPQSWVELARLQVSLDRLASARRTLERAQQQHPEVLEIDTARANLFRREGRAEQAYAAYGALAQKYPERGNIFRALLQTASEAGRHVEALELLEDTRLVKTYAAELQRARLLYDLGESSKALDILARVAQPDGKVFVPVLLYRGLGKHARASAMYVSHFESQMEALREADYTAVTVKELGRMASGDVPFPERPIVITFDNARLQSLQLGDPVLARHGLKASMFVSASSVREGHPRFADWQVLSSFAMTRRWDLQSQGQRAHDLVTVTPNGEQGSFLTDHILLPEKPRYETGGEYRRRVHGDSGTTLAASERRRPGSKVVGYAFASSEAGWKSSKSDPFPERHFDFSFIEDANGYNEFGVERPVVVRRLAVPRDWNGEDLLRHLSLQHPRAQAMAERARIELWMGRYARSRESWAALFEEHPLLRDTAKYYLASIAFHQQQYKKAEQYLESAESLGWSRPEDVAQLKRQLSWQTATRVAPRLAVSGDSADRSYRSRSLRVSPGTLSGLLLELDVGTVRFGEGKLEPMEATELGIGMRGREAARIRWSARVRGRNGRGSSPDSVNLWTGIGYESDNNELWLRVSRQDVDTLRARRRAITANTFQVSELVRIHPSSSVRVDGRLGKLDDGNELSSVSVKMTFLPFGQRRWLFGAVGGWTDSRFQTRAYYTPEKLTWGRGLVGYRNAWAGWRIDGTLELGWGRDALRGDRLTAHARGSAEQIWSSRIRSSLDWSYSQSPSYHSWAAGIAVHIGLSDMQ